MEPRFFATPAGFRAWLSRHHADTPELLVGFWKKDSGIPSISWPESVDEALCFGWIDGVRKRRDDHSYTIRFTPRRQTSICSAVNLKKVAQLLELGRMQPAGIQAFEQRRPEKVGLYSYEQRLEALDAAHHEVFQQQPAAWAWFENCPASYRRAAMSWVGNAKQASTQERRLASLIDHCARQTTLPQFTRIKPPR